MVLFCCCCCGVVWCVVCVKVDLPPLAILKNMQMFVSQITWWVPHVFVWRSPKRSKMSSHRAIRTPYEIHVDLHMAGAGWVRGPLGRQRARPASILNMPPRAPPAGVCAAGGARRSRTSLEGPGGVPIYFIWPMSSSWTASCSAIQIHGAPTM